MTLEIKQYKKLKSDLLLFLEEREEEIFGKAGLNRWLLPVFAKYGRLFVIYKDGNPAGLAELIRDWDDPKKTYIVGFSIFPEQQEKGLGKEFLAGLIKILKEDKIEKIVLTVDQENQKALNLYRGFGFKEKMISYQEYGPGIDRIIMELILKEKF